MIHYHTATQSLHCTGCGCDVEISRSTAMRPHALVELMERIGHRHRDCDSYRNMHLARNAMRFERNRLRLVRTLAMPSLQRAAD